MDFTIIRGDNRDLAIALTREGSAYTIAADDELIFTAKASTADLDANAKFQKIRTGGITTSGTTATVAILHADTKNLTNNILVWDIQVRQAAGVPFTGAIGFLFLTHDVTREVDPSVDIITTNPISSFASLTSRISTEESTRSTADGSLSTRITGLQASDINDDSELAAGTVAEALMFLSTEIGRAQNVVTVSSSRTAIPNWLHVNVATVTYTDPTPSEGMLFEVLVANGTATVGGTAYGTAGNRIVRVFHSGAWTNYRYAAS
jgi:hypothetical protein